VRHISLFHNAICVPNRDFSSVSFERVSNLEKIVAERR